MLKKVLYILSIAALTACDDSVMTESPFLNGVEKTPVETSVLLDVAVAPSTRAQNKEFVSGDKLLAYLRHVTWDGETTGVRTLVSVQNSPKLVVFTKGSAACSDYNGSDITPIGTNASLGLSSDNTKQTSDLTASPKLYWDDFSRASTGSEVEGAFDIRTSGHYLQSYYGYCFNGGEGTDNAEGAKIQGNISQALDKTTGVLGWTVPDDQTETLALQHSDLLWSAEQTPIAYQRGSSASDGHGTLVIPYTHAMSMVTVEVIAKDGFTTGALADTWLELQGMNRTCTLTAPTMTISDAGKGSGTDAGKVNMYKGTPTTNVNGNPSCTYQAIVVPGTALSEGSVFLKIYDADGNNYDLKIKSSILTSWNRGLTDNKMQSGYNYHLTVTINKVGVDVQSTLSDWKTVKAEGEGDIQFPEDDVTEIYTTTDGDGNPTGSKVDFSTIDGKKLANFNTGSSFSLYKKDIGESNAYDYATTSTYTLGTGTGTGTNYWKNDPEIYWPNDHDKFYFRALAIYNAPAEDGSYNIQAYTPTSSNTVTQATDYVWATTPAHKVKKTDGSGEATYAKSAAITPRTGDVPLAFEHVMSKITVKLATSTAADAVDLSSALLSISKLVDSGTISIEDGTITGGSIADTPISEFCPSGQMLEGKTVLENYTMIPQQITDDAIMTIKLADGTTYKLQLNTCVQDGGTAPIKQWLRGIHYTYTITLKKEAISFRVMIKDWDEKTGSGNANLDWD